MKDQSLALGHKLPLLVLDLASTSDRFTTFAPTLKGPIMATSHHGDEYPADFNKQFSALYGKEADIMQRFIEQVEGRAKRNFPDGQLDAKDAGEIAFAVGTDKQHGLVILDFGKPVAWLAMCPSEVAGLVKLLIQKAREVATEPFTIEF